MTQREWDQLEHLRHMASKAVEELKTDDCQYTREALEMLRADINELLQEV